LSSESLSSTFSSLLEWSFTMFCFCLIFFWGFLYLLSPPLLYFLLSSLIHLSLFVECPLFHFGVCLGLLWVHLFLCCPMFFIFGILKFLGCILYILANHVWYLLYEILSDFLQDFFFEGVFWSFLGSLVSFIIVLLGSGTVYLFYSFPSESCIKFSFRRVISIPSSSFHCSTWCCVTMFLIG
jgi:hypothetical protein